LSFSYGHKYGTISFCQVVNQNNNKNPTSNTKIRTGPDGECLRGFFTLSHCRTTFTILITVAAELPSRSEVL
jgi:hypothetical protein